MEQEKGIITSPGGRSDPWASIVKDGIVKAWPICLGYVPIGLAFGVIAQKAGLGPLEIGMMSVLVFAGSAQFIGVSMLSAGAGFIPIVMTTFMVNLRHLLMSSSLAVYLRGINRGRLSLFAYGVTDESFAMNLTLFRETGWDWRRGLVLNHTANVSWIVSTIAGGYGGQFIPAGAFGIDYALIGMFLCLIVFQLRGMLYVIIAAIAGLLAVVISLVVPGNSYIVIASILSATIGLVMRRAGYFKEEEQAS
ncbi:MAG: AzlC family ABC transporter permease [Deltaproteobacteria bacterium]|nr:AzlC family ABC transporter permease [Deltaproteobacteria bacterium]MBN2688953.1 AzlC family ABC transporter permease [Deltaproteobacteria bacterium]